MKGISYSYNGYESIVIKFIKESVEYTLDTEQLIFLLNENKPFSFRGENVDYPYYIYNKHKIDLLELLYKSRGLNVTFKDDDKTNLKTSNVMLTHEQHDYILSKYPAAVFVYSYVSLMGKDSMLNKNPIWKIGETDYIMLCEPESSVFLDEYSFSIVKKHYTTFFKCTNGYIAGRINGKQLYLHQIIMDCYGNGKGTSTKSVDHIDRDPLNNRYDNLRIVDADTQRKNSKGIMKGTKRARKKTARKLPEGLTQNMMEKYVVYYRECYNKEKQLFREFFKVEKHPKLEKIWCSSKSNKIPLKEKLEKANKIVTDLNELNTPESIKDNQE